MNEELIHKFYEKAKVQRNTEWGDNITFFDYRKFAELIIKECCAVCNEFGEDVENGNIFGSTEKKLGKDIKSGHLGPLLWRASELMKEHFGIKE